MPKRGQSKAQVNKAIRQEALREQLSSQGHLQHVIVICDELNDLTTTMETLDVTRKKIVLDTKLRLINKYLPDLKSTEISGKDGGAIEMITEVVRKIVG